MTSLAPDRSGTVKSVSYACSPCLSCDGEIGRRNKTGYCRKCCSTALVKNPAWKEAQRAGIKRKLASDPEFLAKLRARARKVGSDPATSEKRTRYFRENKVWQLGNAVQTPGSDARVRAGRSISATRMAWCPTHLREAYRELVYSKQIPAPQARAMILEQHEAEMKRWRREHGFVKEVKLEPLVEPEIPPHALPHQVVLIRAAASAGVSVEDILGHEKNRDIVRGRWLAMLGLSELGMSVSAIGRMLGYAEHTSVLYGLKKARTLREGDAHFALAARRLAA